MTYKEIKQDITTVKLLPCTAIAHCVSCDCAMGAGVALAICNKHTTLRNICKEHAKIAPYYIGDLYRHVDEYGTVYCMFTKLLYWHNANNLGETNYLSALKMCLELLRDQMRNNFESVLYMPKIASGNDKCNWEKVNSLLWMSLKMKTF